MSGLGGIDNYYLLYWHSRISDYHCQDGLDFHDGKLYVSAFHLPDEIDDCLFEVQQKQLQSKVIYSLILRSKYAYAEVTEKYLS